MDDMAASDSQVDTPQASPTTRAASPSAPRLRLGTRASALARWQAEWVAAELAALGVPTELIHISTQGDVTSGPLGAMGGQGVFTKEIQRALLRQEIDLAVHSLKDLPTEPVAGLIVAAVPLRESVRDVLVSPTYRFETLPPGARIGTGSTRRRSQLLHARPDLDVQDIRGNVDTRLRKLDEGQYEAIVLAQAGLTRLGLQARITEVLPPSLMLSAVGQGALGIETRADDQATREALRALDHPDSHEAVLAERALLARLRAGCLAPVGAWARVEDGVLRLDAVVLSSTGQERIAASGSGELGQAETLGQRVADELVANGAARLIATSRATTS